MESSKDTLGDRIKRYEAAITEQYFMQDLPLYARIDGRAFHTLTKGLGKPWPIPEQSSSKTNHYDVTFLTVMQYVCKELVRETNATLGYVQSDEISLCWTNVKGAPFDRRKFKLESVIPALATGFFVKRILDKSFNDENGKDIGKLRQKISNIMPSFDCRVFQVPNLMELANCLVWRENDAIKNSISSYAMDIFPTKALHGKNQKDRLEMLAENKTFWEDLPLQVRRGTYYTRVARSFTDPNGESYIRANVEQYFSHEKLAKIENKVEYLFMEHDPILIDRSLGESGDTRKVL